MLHAEAKRYRISRPTGRGRDAVGRRLRAFLFVVAVSVAIGCLVAPAPAIADDQIVCVELPYNGPPLPAGVEIGTALRCEKVPAYESEANDSSKARVSTAHTSTPVGPSINEERRAVPVQPPKREIGELVPASKPQNESAPSGRPSVTLLALALLLPLALMLGRSIVVHRRIAAFRTIAAD